MSGVATALRVLSGEGARAVRDRALDRLAEARRRRSFRPAGEGWRAEVPILAVGAYPPAARFGGVQAQWRTRLEAEEALRPVALLYPEASGYRLEVSTGPGGERRSLDRPGRPPASRALRDPDFEDAVLWAAAKVGARALQVEGAAGLPPASLLRLAQELPLILALHDFALFCPRPHLLEEPSHRFCDYCRDLPRCGACLGEAPELQARWRAAGSALLAAIRAAVFPSAFLERAYAELFGPLPILRRVIPPPFPGSAGVLAGSSSPTQPAGTPALPGKHLALVGGVQAHKGAEVFLEMVERLDAAGYDFSYSAYGGGDPALLARLRATGRVRVRGYYRTGSLPRLLRRDQVDLALLPSVVPESFSLVLSECRAAGVPVLAFDLGALGERLRAEGGGLAVPLAQGAAGMAALAATVVDGREAVPPPVEDALPAPREIAQAWLDLYRLILPSGR